MMTLSPAVGVRPGAARSRSHLSLALMSGAALHIGLIAWLATFRAPPPQAVPTESDPPFLVNLAPLIHEKPLPQPTPQKAPAKHAPSDQRQHPSDPPPTHTATKTPPVSDGPPAHTETTRTQGADLPHVAEVKPGPPRIDRPHWLSVPNGDEFAAFYPDRAARLGKEGQVRLDCRVGADGRLDGCRIGQETPTAYGFGDASLKIVKFFRMAPQMEDGKPVAGGEVAIAIKWALPN